MLPRQGHRGAATLGDTMPKIVFSSDQLPASLNDQARFRLWQDLWNSRFGAAEFVAYPDRPFSARHEFLLLGDLNVTRQHSTLQHWFRSSRHVAKDARGDFLLGYNRSSSSPTIIQRNREVVLASGQPTLFTNGEAAESHSVEETSLVGICMPRARLLERVAHSDDLVQMPLDSTTPAARLLRGYLELLLDLDGAADDPLLVAHAESTLIDLVVLTLGAGGEAAEIARMRGLRAARLQEIFAAIKAGYADPAFAVRGVAHKLGLSPRYVNDLLHETGVSLVERVLELRLQKARAMLADPHHDRLKIIEIAYACGFSEVSYFNRCFRRRFGASPTQYRGTPSGHL